ncbi:MAG: LON peptidase substrate-binding domain-containing protein [Cyclobacteriaceae bacterium]|nr:LON peptidase substrate-binding domain-containing protein [Cyclobacteriaceae bacterium]
MSDLIKIPMFPLTIFPLPGEMVPLHIFEPRYRQLLDDAETKDISFGIYFNHALNSEKFGALVKLESIIKRYPSGESDIIVKCTDLFVMDTLYRTFKDKLYPGGDVSMMNIDMYAPTSVKLLEKYKVYAAQMNITPSTKNISIYHIANDLSMDFESKLKFVSAEDERKENFLFNQLTYHHQLLLQAEKSKDVFHLN